MKKTEKCKPAAAEPNPAAQIKDKDLCAERRSGQPDIRLHSGKKESLPEHSGSLFLRTCIIAAEGRRRSACSLPWRRESRILSCAAGILL